MWRISSHVPQLSMLLLLLLLSSLTCSFFLTPPFSLTTSLSPLPHSFSLSHLLFLSSFFPPMSLAGDDEFIIEYNVNFEDNYLVDEPTPSTSQISSPTGFAISDIEHSPLSWTVRKWTDSAVMTTPSDYISHGQGPEHSSSTDSHTVKVLLFSSITCSWTLHHTRIAVLGLVTHNIVQTPL
jgi:hypothetical protein